MKRQIKAAVLVVTVLFSAVFLLSACRNKTEETKNLPKLVIGSDYYEPYNYIDNAGNPTGIDVEIATEACRRIGYEPVFKNIDWDNKDSILENGEVDCLWGSFSMNGREDAYKWAGPYLNSRQIVVVRAQSNIYKLSDIAGHNVSTQFGSKPAEILLDGSLGFTAKNVYCFSTISEVFMAMSNGYTDACAGHETALTTFINDNSGEYRILDDSLLVANLGAAFAKDETDFPVEKLSEVLDEMKKDGTIKNIVIKYGLDPEKVLN